MRRTKFLKKPPCRMPEGAGNTVIAASQILTEGDEEVLEISLFYQGRLGARYFADEENYYTWSGGRWSVCKIGNAGRMSRGEQPLKGDIWSLGREWSWATDQDKMRAFDFLDTYSMEDYETNVNDRKREAAVERKKDRIRAKMNRVPAVPQEAEVWVKQKVFPVDILFIRKGERYTNYACTACRAKSRKKAGWKHGEETVCPRCGRPVTVNSRRKEKKGTEPVVILQQCDGKWVERQFKAVCRWSGNGKETRLYEQCRAVIKKGERRGKVWYGLRQEADEYEQEFWDKNPQNKRFVPSFLWPGNLAEVLPCGGLEKSGLDVLAGNMQKINVNGFILSFGRKPWVEYLIKAGLIKMAAEIIDRYWEDIPKGMSPYARSLQGALGLDGNRVSRLKELNGGLCELRWLQYEQRKAIKISGESLCYLGRKHVGPDDCREMLEAAGSVNRMVNYMKKQGRAVRPLIITWRDYLRMAGNEGMDIRDDIVRFPRNLQAAHDRLTELGNARRDRDRLAGYASLDARIRERLSQAARYCWQDDTYLIVPAAACIELMEEGRALHHCVGRDDHYMEKMAKGESWILFLRKKENPEKPWYTIEIGMADDQIIQWYAEFDRKPDGEEVRKILRAFKKDIKGRRGRVRVPAVTTA